MAEIPPKLRARWEKFGRAARECWTEAKKIVEPKKDFLQFMECMEERARESGFLPEEELSSITAEQAKKCAELGYPVAPHPICILRKVSEGLSEAEAIDRCLEEGKFHGISALRCEALLRERKLT